MIQNKCLDVCNKTREKITYEEDAIYESCKYSLVSINELENKYDLVIDSHKYDDLLDF